MSLTESLITEFGTQIESLTLYPSGGGVFDVRAGDDLIYSKRETGRFPNPADVEIIKKQIRQHSG